MQDRQDGQDASRADGRTGGLFVTFEGGDGVGKTTQVGLLRAWLEERGRRVLCLHEPGGTELGEKIRALLLGREQDGMDPVAELLLFEAARAQLVNEKIRPALARGEVVLCDRFTDSTLAYQGHGRRLGAELVERLNGAATGGLEPDLTFLLVMDEAQAETRVAERAAATGEGLDRMELAGDAFRERVDAGFSAIAAAHPERVRVIDAAQPVGAVHAAIVCEMTRNAPYAKRIPSESRLSHRDAKRVVPNASDAKRVVPNASDAKRVVPFASSGHREAGE